MRCHGTNVNDVYGDDVDDGDGDASFSLVNTPLRSRAASSSREHRPSSREHRPSGCLWHLPQTLYGKKAIQGSNQVTQGPPAPRNF